MHNDLHGERVRGTIDRMLIAKRPAPLDPAAIAAVRRGGVIVQVGMLGLGLHEIDFGSIVTKEIRVHGAFRFNNEMSDALSLLEQNPEIERCISHEFPIESWEEAFRVAKDSKASGKVVIALNVKER